MRGLMHPEDWLKQDEALELFALVQTAFSRRDSEAVWRLTTSEQNVATG